MVGDGLHDKIPGCYSWCCTLLLDMVPVLIAEIVQHPSPEKTGTLCITSGTALSAAGSFDVAIHERGGHGSSPQTCIDPVVISSYIVRYKVS